MSRSLINAALTARAALRSTSAAVELQPNPMTPVTIEDIRLDRRGTGDDWIDAISFEDKVENEKQFESIIAGGANTIEIEFTGDVNFAAAGDELVLLGTNPEFLSTHGYTFEIDLEFDASTNGTNVARWTINAFDPGEPEFPLPAGKYALFLVNVDGITDSGGNAISADWDNDDNGPPNTIEDNTPDDISDDVSRPFDLLIDETFGSLGNQFRFHFLYAPGDFDRDGDVDFDDISVFNNPGGADVDANRNGIDGDSGDIDVYNAHLGYHNLAPFSEADWNDDDIIDTRDRFVWEEAFMGTPTSDASADADGDGDSDGDDILIWLQHIGQRTAWWSGIQPPMPGESGGGSVPPPQVLNVIVTGSASTHAPFSFDTVDGDGDQLRTVPVGAADTVSIVFSEDVKRRRTQPNSLRYANR